MLCFDKISLRPNLYAYVCHYHAKITGAKYKCLHVHTYDRLLNMYGCQLSTREDEIGPVSSR